MTASRWLTWWVLRCTQHNLFFGHFGAWQMGSSTLAGLGGAALHPARPAWDSRNNEYMVCCLLAEGRGPCAGLSFPIRTASKPEYSSI